MNDGDSSDDTLDPSSRPMVSYPRHPAVMKDIMPASYGPMLFQAEGPTKIPSHDVAVFTQKRVHVVSALIVNDQYEMLMALRRPDGIRPDSWENPGGKVDPHEADDDALRREIQEELGVHAYVGDLISVGRLDVEVTLLLRLYAVMLADKPKALASAGLRWVTPSYAIKKLPCSPATYLYYRDIEQRMDYLRMVAGGLR